jgi:acyl-CoA synthetase (AMP-forming)/AMP-acid ligase II
VGEEGHVWVRTAALMRGYYQRDDLTMQVVRQGWFSTGDIGLLDSNEMLYLRGREREEINKGGAKVHPADIDNVIEQFPSVKDVCAFAYPDELLGEDVGIALVLQDDDEPTRSALFEWTQQRLTSHKIPIRWYVVDEIPRTSRGKINRSEVSRHCSKISPTSFAGGR